MIYMFWDGYAAGYPQPDFLTDVGIATPPCGPEFPTRSCGKFLRLGQSLV